MALATTTGTSPSNTPTTLHMTSVFTPPAPCSTYWTYEPFSYNKVYPSGLLMQNCENVVSSCFPSGFANSGRQTATRIYSPGYCPMGYTSADIAIDGPVTTAICCYSYDILNPLKIILDIDLYRQEFCLHYFDDDL
jgi:hypothetical protein